MFFIVGVSPRLRQLGSASGVCPACHTSGRLCIVKRSQWATLFFIPLIPFGGEYIATCNGCASVLAVRKDAGRRFERDPGAPLGLYDFEIVQDNHGPRCPRCGHRANPGYAFCPGCGSRL